VLTLTGALPSGVTFTDNGNGTGTLSGTPAAGTGAARRRRSSRRASLDDGDLGVPAPPRSLAKSGGGVIYNTGKLTAMAGQALAPAGGDQPHNNLQPYLTFYFCIALQGVFPPRGDS
jgi:hypothetical protein